MFKKITTCLVFVIELLLYFEFFYRIKRELEQFSDKFIEIV